VRVLVFYPGGANEDELRRKSVPVRSLGKGGRWDMVRFAVRLAREIRRRKPDALYSLLPGPNVVAGLMRPALGDARLVMGVRASDMDLRRYDRVTRAVYALEGRLARRADAAIANSDAAGRAALARGFPADRLYVVRNGFDTARFRPDGDARAVLRHELGVAPDVPLIGMVARVDPMKDHATFLEAASILSRVLPNARFALAGAGADPSNGWLGSQIKRRGLEAVVRLLGERADIERVYPALDIATLSSSFGEGFPNALGEAMACGVPCVATAVGDAPALLDGVGRVVAPCDAPALAGAWRALAELPVEARRRLGEASRRRIVLLYGETRMIEDTEQRLSALIVGARPRPGESSRMKMP